MDSALLKWLNRVEGKIDKLNIKVEAQPCQVNTDRINMLMRVVYGAVGIILVVWVLSTTGRDSTATKTSETTIETKQVEKRRN